MYQESISHPPAAVTIHAEGTPRRAYRAVEEREIRNTRTLIQNYGPPAPRQISK